MTTMSHTSSVARPVQREQATAKVAFVSRQTIIDRDFEIADRIKFIGVSVAATVTLITGAVFLFA